MTGGERVRNGLIRKNSLNNVDLRPTEHHYKMGTGTKYTLNQNSVMTQENTSVAPPLNKTEKRWL